MGFAISGVLSALRSENSFRVHVLAACGVFGVLLWRRPSRLWWAVIALTVVAVLAAELMNTAVERLIDHLHPERHPEIKIVKDCAAGAVLVVSVGALCVALAFILDQWF